MNRLNFQELKAVLDKNEAQLYDGGYLEPDIQVIYEFYKDHSRPPLIEEYFKKFNEFKFIEFLKTYIKDVLGEDVQIGYTSDQWLEIKK